MWKEFSAAMLRVAISWRKWLYLLTSNFNCRVVTVALDFDSPRLFSFRAHLDISGKLDLFVAVVVWVPHGCFLPVSKNI